MLSLFSGVASIASFIQQEPIAVAAGFLGLFGFTLGAVLLRRWLLPFFEVRSALRRLVKQLTEASVRPTHILGFNRQGATIAGMLAVNVGVDQLIVVPRRQDARAGSQQSPYTFSVGDGVSLDPTKFVGAHLLVVFLCVDTGSSLKESLDYLKASGVYEAAAKVSVASLFLTLGASRQFSDRIYYGELSHDAATILNRLPWNLDGGNYPRLPAPGGA